MTYEMVSVWTKNAKIAHVTLYKYWIILTRVTSLYFTYHFLNYE